MMRVELAADTARRRRTRCTARAHVGEHEVRVVVDGGGEEVVAGGDAGDQRGDAISVVGRGLVAGRAERRPLPANGVRPYGCGHWTSKQSNCGWSTTGVVVDLDDEPHGARSRRRRRRCHRTFRRRPRPTPSRPRSRRSSPSRPPAQRDRRDRHPARVRGRDRRRSICMVNASRASSSPSPRRWSAVQPTARTTVAREPSQMSGVVVACMSQRCR